MTRFDEAYYVQNYGNYARQNPARKLAHYRSVVERHMSAGLPRRIHDVGCAFGDFLLALGPQWERYGSDASDYAINVAKRRAPDIDFRTGSADIHAPTRFGAITAFDVLEHIPDLDAVGAQIGAQLVPHGVFTFVVPVYDGASGPLISLLDRDPTHVHKWNRSRWLSWAASRFDVVSWHGLLRYLLPGGQYLHLATETWRRHTPAILVVCRQPAAPS